MTKEELRAFNKTRRIGQLCYVSYDYRETIKYLTEKLMMGPWQVFENIPENTEDVHADGKPINEPWRYYIAITMMGDMQIEVIQPISGPSPYWKFLCEKGPGIHHFKEVLDGTDELLAHVRKLEENGVVNCYGGRCEEDIYQYMDTYKALGAYVEIGNGKDDHDFPPLEEIPAE